MNSYDVIVIGAGPAGATLGYELSRRGLTVLILEKEKLPRYKPCAGGITRRAASLLNFDINSVIERTAYGARITYQLGDECTKRNKEPLLYTVMRSKFDHFLVQKAQEAGATVSDGVRANCIQMTGSAAEVITSVGHFTAKVVVGADGAKGMVAKNVGLTADVEHGLAIEQEVYVAQNKLSNWDSLVWLDIGHIPGGYGWVFPKKDQLSVGVGGPIHFSKRLKPYLERLMRHLGDCEVANSTGHLMPVRTRKMAIQRGNALLLGDAAALVHPLTGEGIYYAIRSAQLAAPVIANTLRNNAIDLRGYEQAVDAQLMPSIESGRVLSDLFTKSPRFYFDLVKGDDRIWSYACDALLGAPPIYT
jgi:geranylgeranyl reductase family protein